MQPLQKSSIMFQHLSWTMMYCTVRQTFRCQEPAKLSKLSTNLEMSTRSRIHERTISLRFLGIILRVLRREVSIYHVYITNQIQATFAFRGDCEQQGEKLFRLFSQYVQVFGLFTTSANLELHSDSIGSPDSDKKRPYGPFKRKKIQNFLNAHVYVLSLLWRRQKIQ